MRDMLAPVLCSLLVVGGATAFALWCLKVETDQKVRERESAVLETTPRLLAADPEFYRNRLVKVRTEGMELLNQNELGYRKRADQGPVVLIRSSAPFPQPLPPLITGTCKGRAGLDGPVLIVVE